MVTSGKERKISRTLGASFADSSKEMVYGIVARTHNAPSSSCGMNSAPMLGMSSIDTASTMPERERRDPRMRQAKIQTAGVDGFDRFENGIAPFAHALAHDPRAQHRQQGQRDDRASRPARNIIVSAIGLNSVPEGPDST